MAAQESPKAAKKAAPSQAKPRGSSKKAAPRVPSTKKSATKKASPKKVPAKKAALRPAGTAGKADGDAPVLAHIASLPPKFRAAASTLDAIVTKNVPGVKRAIKWSTPFYGMEGKGWFCAFGAFKNHCVVNFFRGDDLKPRPPEGSRKGMRRIVYHDVAEIDEKQLTSWVKQASALQGWGK